MFHYILWQTFDHVTELHRTVLQVLADASSLYFRVAQYSTLYIGTFSGHVSLVQRELSFGPSPVRITRWAVKLHAHIERSVTGSLGGYWGLSNFMGSSGTVFERRYEDRVQLSQLKVANQSSLHSRGR